MVLLVKIFVLQLRTTHPVKITPFSLVDWNAYCPILVTDLKYQKTKDELIINKQDYEQHYHKQAVLVVVVIIIVVLNK